MIRKIESFCLYDSSSLRIWLLKLISIRSFTGWIFSIKSSTFGSIPNSFSSLNFMMNLSKWGDGWHGTVSWLMDDRDVWIALFDEHFKFNGGLRELRIRWINSVGLVLFDTKDNWLDFVEFLSLENFIDMLNFKINSIV